MEANGVLVRRRLRGLRQIGSRNHDLFGFENEKTKIDVGVADEADSTTIREVVGRTKGVGALSNDSSRKCIRTEAEIIIFALSKMRRQKSSTKRQNNE